MTSISRTVRFLGGFWTRSKPARNTLSRRTSFLEPLEDRRLLAVSFAPLASDLNQTLQVQQQRADADILSTALPIISNQLQGNVPLLGEFRSDLVTALTGLNTDAAIQQALFDVLGPAGKQLLVDGNSNGVDLADITITSTELDSNPGNGPEEVRFDALLRRDLTVIVNPFTFDLALPAVGLDVATAGGIEVKVGWTYKLGIGVDQTGFFYDASATDDLAIAISTTADFDLQATLGPLFARITDDPGQPISFSPTLTVDIAGNDAKLRTSELAGMTVSGTVDTVGGIADFTVKLDLALLDPATSPELNLRITTPLHVRWDLTGEATGTPLASFGNLEDVSFTDIQLDLGGFLSNFLAPNFDQIAALIDPLVDIAAALGTPLFDSQPTPFGTIIFPTLAQVIKDASEAAGFMPPVDLQPFVGLINAFATAHSLLANFVSTESIALGSFKFVNAKVDNAAQATSNPDAFGQAKSAGVDPSGFFDVAKSAGFDFPILESPVDSAMKLLLGENLDLIAYTTPGKTFTFPAECLIAGTIVTPVGPISAGLTVGAEVTIDPFRFAYDTAGLMPSRDIFDGFYLDLQPVGVPPHSPEIKFSAFIKGAVGYGVFECNQAFTLQVGLFAEVGIEGEIRVTPTEPAVLNGNPNTPDQKLRFDEIQDCSIKVSGSIDGVASLAIILSGGIQTGNPVIDGLLGKGANAAGGIVDGAEQIFSGDVAGGVETIAGGFSLDGGVDIGAGPGGMGASIQFRKDLQSVRREFVSFTIDCLLGEPSQAQIAAVPDANLATLLPNGVLRLNVGIFATERNVFSDEINEEYVVTLVDVGGVSMIRVMAFGRIQDFTADQVRKIVAEAGDGMDRIEIDDSVTVEAELHGGADNDVLIAGGGLATFHGGNGDDTLEGGPANDLLYGDQGNDLLIGNGGVDYLDAGAGNDFLFGDDLGQTLAGDDVLLGGDGADQLFAGMGNDYLTGGDGPDVLRGGEGIDILHGGAGGDVLRGDAGADLIYGGDDADVIGWTEGDGSDPEIDGGGGQDFLLVEVADTADDMGVSAFGNHVRLARTNQVSFALTVSGVEQFLLGLGGGADKLAIGDLTATDLTFLGADLGLTDNAIDAIAVQGTSLGDQVSIARSNEEVVVDGLWTRIVLGSASASSDVLTVLGNEGSDVIKAEPGTENQIAITLDGGNGDDVLSADAILIGGPGDDFLEGGLGDDQFFGNDGEDTMIGHGGNDTYDGGAGFDTILIRGTAGNDSIDVDQPDATTLRYAISGVIGVAPTEIDTLVLGTVEEARIEAEEGADVIRITPSEALILAGTPQFSLRFTVEGGPGNVQDRLGVVDAGQGDLVIQRLGADDQSGSISVGALAPVVYEGTEFVQVTPLDAVTGGTGTGGAGRLLVFKHDPFESNNSRLNAFFLGSGAVINADPTIDPGADPIFTNLVGDEDWYRVVAAATGTLDFQVYFTQVSTLTNTRAGLPGNGNLDIEVRDANGNLVAGFGANDATNDERVRIPAVEGQTYYLRVRGATSAAINQYTMTILNSPAPLPFDIELLDFPVDGTPNPPGTSANSDTGRSQFDNVTYDNDPTVLIRVADSALLNDIPDNNGNPGSPPDETIGIPFVTSTANNAPSAGFRVAVFLTENNTHTQVGYASQVAGSPGVYSFTFPANFLAPDGSYFISARVEMIDPTAPEQNQGFGDFAQSLEIVVDTLPPPVSFGQSSVAGDGLTPESDSGVSPPNNDTLDDRITNDTTPSFWGRAEANTIIRLFVDVNGNGTFQPGIDVFIGQDTAIPLDGTNQEADGSWEIQSILSFNDNDLFPLDGLRTVFVTAEDLAGNVNAPGDASGADADEILQIFIDTQGPQITEVEITDYPNYDLFNPKGPEANLQGPTPLVSRLTIHFRDLPARVANFLYVALKDDTVALDHFQVSGDQNGHIAIDNLILNQPAPGAGGIATATVTLVFTAPLPDDRFTLIVSDEVRDIASNRLDGETDAAEPQEDPDFRTPPFSGDGVPGGDFIARFTVDSRPELGVYAGIRVYVDLNGNFVFDPEGQDNDAVNRDIVFRFGSTSDALFAGKFVSPGTALVPEPPNPAALGGVSNRYFDQVAAYGSILGVFSWVFDFDSDGVADFITVQDPGVQINGTPVAGNFDGDITNGDEVGLFTGTQWFLDTNHNFKIDPFEGPINSLIAGLPQVGDIDGDGQDDFVTFSAVSNSYFIDFAFDGLGLGFVAVIPFTSDGGGLGFPGISERPAVADMNQDGIDDLGVWVPGNVGQSPTGISEWYFLVSQVTAGGLPVTHVPGAQVPLPPAPVEPGALQPAYNTLWAFPSHTGLSGVPHFQPVPFGTSLFAMFGDEPAFPIVGNFDPPVGGGGSPDSTGGLDSNNVVVAAAGAGAEPRVHVYDRLTGELVLDILAYNPAFRGGVQVATADVNGDGTVDIITAPGAGGGPHIRVFDGVTGNVLREFFAYDPAFTGGVLVAAGDIDGDGDAEIVTGPGAGGGPHVRIFDGSGAVLGEYFAYNPAFGGGVNVAVGDINGDGTLDVITGAGAGGGPHVRVFSGITSDEIQGFFAYNPAFGGGVYVAAGDVDGDGRDDVITGAGAGGGPHVRVFSGDDGAELAGFFAYDAAFAGGVRVASGDFDGDGRADILTGPGVGGGPHVRAFDGDTLDHVATFMAFDESFTGGVFVAAPNLGGGQALRAATAGSGGAALSQSQLDQFVAAVFDTSRVRVKVANLPGTTLGLAYSDLVLIDSDAAGHGWFVDSTPDTSDDLDADRIDLLSALAHEIGHVLGLEDTDDGSLMDGELSVGVRASLEAIDAVFAGIG